jgi:Esterase-like activity of phytase
MEDSFYKQSRFFKIDTTTFPYTLTKEYRLTDPKGLLDDVDRNATFILKNNDTTVNLDLEGIAKSATGGFWLVSEGGNTTESPNLLLKVDDAGVITKVVTLPSAVAARQVCMQLCLPTAMLFFLSLTHLVGCCLFCC